MFRKSILWLELIIISIISGIIISGGGNIHGLDEEKYRQFTRNYEFDYFDWTLDAVYKKISQMALGSQFYFSEVARKEIVYDYLDLTNQVFQIESRINQIYSDPEINDPEGFSKEIREELKKLRHLQNLTGEIAESILEQQVKTVLISERLSNWGQLIPPILFHITPLPYHLVISQRDKIEQETSISLNTSLVVNDQESIENKIDSHFDVSSLVVPVGGIGSYPTMVERSSSINWLLDTVAHEWIHNWLELRPLGRNYETSAELRTMNETTASIAGSEIGKVTIQRFYPEKNEVSDSTMLISDKYKRPDPDDLPRHPFDFREEMHKTRINVDILLGQGNIDEAEQYMEARRIVFWENGYLIRKLNQAYFAFYGAYADVPGGAAGEDPVGPAVRSLWVENSSLSEFLKLMSRMNSYDDLVEELSK